MFNQLWFKALYYIEKLALVKLFFLFTIIRIVL